MGLRVREVDPNQGVFRGGPNPVEGTIFMVKELRDVPPELYNMLPLIE